MGQNKILFCDDINDDNATLKEICSAKSLIDWLIWIKYRNEKCLNDVHCALHKWVDSPDLLATILHDFSHGLIVCLIAWLALFSIVFLDSDRFVSNLFFSCWKCCSSALIPDLIRIFLLEGNSERNFCLDENAGDWKDDATASLRAGILSSHPSPHWTRSTQFAAAENFRPHTVWIPRWSASAKEQGRRIWADQGEDTDTVWEAEEETRAVSQELVPEKNWSS